MYTNTYTNVHYIEIQKSKKRFHDIQSNEYVKEMR